MIILNYTLFVEFLKEKEIFILEILIKNLGNIRYDVLLSNKKFMILDILINLKILRNNFFNKLKIKRTNIENNMTRIDIKHTIFFD